MACRSSINDQYCRPTTQPPARYKAGKRAVAGQFKFRRRCVKGRQSRAIDHETESRKFIWQAGAELAGVAQEGLILTEAQVIALEKAKTEKEAHGEFES
jgi:hypothetical protein